MCKLGDIIVVNKYIGDDGIEISRHPFVVVNDEGGTIAGIEYSIVAAVISSFKSEADRKRRLAYKGNTELPIDAMNNKNFRKSSYIKADKAFYFNKDRLDYYVLGTLKEEYLDELLKLILQLAKDGKLDQIIANL